MALYRFFELFLGWLAIVLATLVVLYTDIVAHGFDTGNVAPDTLHRYLLAFGVIMLALALGVTLDAVFEQLVGRVLLILATLAFAGETFCFSITESFFGRRCCL